MVNAQLINQGSKNYETRMYNYWLALNTNILLTLIIFTLNYTILNIFVLPGKVKIINEILIIVALASNSSATISSKLKGPVWF